MTIVWIWTAAALAGLGFSWWNVRDSDRDVEALRSRRINGDASAAARFLRDSERLRGLQQGLLAFVGIAALATPLLPESWAEAIGEALGWVLVAHVLLLLGNSAQSTIYRRRLRRPTEDEEVKS